MLVLQKLQEFAQTSLSLVKQSMTRFKWMLSIFPLHLSSSDSDTVVTNIYAVTSILLPYTVRVSEPPYLIKLPVHVYSTGSMCVEYVMAVVRVRLNFFIHYIWTNKTAEF